MIRIGILGDIGSGKSYVAKSFGYPVFNADYEVSKLYKKNKKVYQKLKKIFPEYICQFPVNKVQLSNAILANSKNLKKIIKIVHREIKYKMKIFLRKNSNKKIVILDVPLLLENKINKKDDVLVFIESKKIDIQKNLQKRKNYNYKLLKKFKSIQLPLDYKRKKSKFIIKNKFTKKSVNVEIDKILKKINL